MLFLPYSKGIPDIQESINRYTLLQELETSLERCNGGDKSFEKLNIFQNTNNYFLINLSRQDVRGRKLNYSIDINKELILKNERDEDMLKQLKRMRGNFADGGFTPDVSDGTQFMSGVHTTTRSSLTRALPLLSSAPTTARPLFCSAPTTVMPYFDNISAPIYYHFSTCNTGQCVPCPPRECGRA